MPQPTTQWSQRNGPRRAGMPVDCFTGALWNISINDKRTILLMRRVGKAALHTNTTRLPRPPLLEEAVSVRCQQLWVYVLYSRRSDSIVANEDLAWPTQALLYLPKWKACITALYGVILEHSGLMNKKKCNVEKSILQMVFASIKCKGYPKLYIIDTMNVHSVLFS